MRPFEVLKVRCDCSHGAVFNRIQAASAFGLDATPMDIRERLVCSACGAKGRAQVWI